MPKGEILNKKTLVFAAVAATVVFVASSALFVDRTYENTKRDVFASVRDIEKRNVAMLRQNLSINKDFVTSISITLGRLTPVLNSPEAIRFVREQNWFISFGVLYVINEEGSMYFGKIGNDEEKEYFLNMMSDNLPRSDIRVTESAYGGHLSINSVIIHQGRAIGVLLARYYTDRLNETVTFDIFDGKGYCYLLSADGLILARSENAQNKKAADLRDLFSSPFSDEAAEKYYSQIEADMKAGLSGRMIYRLKIGDKVVSYTPVGVSGMYLLTSVPRDVVLSAASGYFFRGIVFVVTLLVAFLGFAFYFFTAMKRNSEITKNAFKELSLVYDNMPGGIVRCYHSGGKWKLVSANRGFYELADVSAEDFEGKYGGDVLGFVLSLLQEGKRKEFENKIVGGEPFETELKFGTLRGYPRWVCFSVEFVKNEDAEIEIVATISDITDIKLADEELHISKEQFDIVKKITNIIFFEWDAETKKVSHSANILDFFDIGERDDDFPNNLLGKSTFSKDDADELIALFEQMKEGLKEGVYEARLTNRFEDLVWYKISMTSILDETGQTIKVVGVLNDIDEQKKRLLQAEEIAMRDPLTQLYNKTTTKDLIERFIEGGRGRGGMLLLDIDSFKQINDTRGHLYGDAVLSELAHTIKTLFRDSDIIGRIGGDEFVVFMSNIKDDSIITKKALRILESFRNTFRKNEIGHGITCSIGISLFPEHGSSFDELMRKADISLYRSKHAGGNRFVFFSDEEEGELMLSSMPREITEINSTHGLVQKNFRENVAEYILKLFYQYDDVDVAVPILLDLVGKSFKMGRIEVSAFSDDQTYYEILYEWCDDGVEALKPGGPVSADEWPMIKPHLDENGIIICADVEKGVPDFLEKDNMRERGVKSAMLCYIVEKDRRRAVLGFEYFKEKHVFSPEEKDIIKTISDTVSLFTLRERERSEYWESISVIKNREAVLDETDEIVYVSDARTYELLYLNKAGRLLHGNAGKCYRGCKCHKFLYGYDRPCQFCTMDLLSKDKYYVWERTDPQTGNHYMLKDKFIDWDGRQARIEWAINFTDKQLLQQKLAARSEIDRALLQGIGEMTYAPGLEESINIILMRVGELYRADRSYMMKLDDGGLTISMTNEWLGEGVSPEMGTFTDFPIGRSTLWHRAFTSNKPFFLENVENIRESQPDDYERLTRQKIEDMYAIPITIKGELWGFLGIDTPRRYKGDMYALESVAYFVADQIAKRMAIEECKKDFPSS